MKKVLIIIFIINSFVLFPQSNNSWVNIPCGNELKDLGFEGEDIWTGGINTGLIRVNFKSNKKYIYTKSNSILPGNDINKIFVDNENTKWIGTDYGLLRIKGDKWNLFNKQNSGLPNDRINGILADAEKNVWIATDSGLVKYDGSSWSVYTKTSQGVSLDTVTAIAVDRQGEKWIGTWGNGVFKFDGSKWTNFRTGNSNLPGNRITSIFVDKRGNRWVGTTNGIARFNGLVWKPYQLLESGIKIQNISSIKTDRNGNIVFVSDDCYFILSEEKIKRITPEDISKINGLDFDSKNNIWIADRSGLITYENSKSKSFNLSELPTCNFENVTIDNNGGCWLWSATELFKYHKNDKTIYNLTETGLENPEIKTIKFDNNNEPWLLVQSAKIKTSLVNISKDGWKVYNSNGTPLPPSDISDYYFDKQNNLRISTKTHGVVSIENSEYKTIKESKKGLLVNSVESIASGGDDISYFLTTKGLQSFDGKKWKLITKNRPGTDFTNKLIITSSNEILIKSNESLYKYDGKKWIKTEPRPEGEIIKSYRISQFGEASRIYLTPDKVIRQSGDIFEVVRGNDPGLNGRILKSAGSDKDGNLYILTEKGLNIYRKDGIIEDR